MGLDISEFLGAPPANTPPPGLLDTEDAPGDRETLPVAQIGGEGSPGWSLPINHFSASSLNMLAVCPRQFQQRYLLGKKEPPTQSQVLGNSFHSTLEHNFRQKIETREDLPVDEVIDFFHDQAWQEATAKAETEGAIRWSDSDDARLSGAKMVTGYLRELAPTVSPEAVETQFSVEVFEVPVPVVGRIDVVTAETIIDLKTSRRKHGKMKPTWLNQGRIYQLASAREAVFHVVTTKGETLDPDLFSIPYTSARWVSTERWVKSLAWMANDLYIRYGAERDWPPTGTAHDWRCDWCGYRKDCPAWRS